MQSINIIVMNCFVDAKYMLRKYDFKLREVFSFSELDLLNKNIFEILGLNNEIVRHSMRKLLSNNSVSLMLLHNHYMKSKNVPALFVFYVYVTKKIDGYNFRFVNWLELVHSMHDSLNWAHNLLTTYNNKFVNVKSSVDVYAFKALYPIVAHKYNDGIYGLSNDNIYSILRCVINIKPRFSKDYKNNVYERLTTSMKKEANNKYVDIYDLMKPSSGLDIKCKSSGICIPRLILSENYLFSVHEDNLATYVMKNNPYNDT